MQYYLLTPGQYNRLRKLERSLWDESKTSKGFEERVRRLRSAHNLWQILCEVKGQDRVEINDKQEVSLKP